MFKNKLVAVVSAGLLAAASLLPAWADTQSSANYEIFWAVNDGGGGSASSANYGLESSAAQPSAMGRSSSANYTLEAGFFAAPDTDTDRILDFMDNCSLDPNESQYDSNGDGFGNRCDPDLDNNGAVNFIDYALLTSAFLSTPASANWNPDADLTGDNVVNFVDISLFQFFFLQPPGPSGLAP